MFNSVRSLPTAPAPTNVSLASSAMLVELGISTWTARKLDKRASEDVTSQNHAQKGMADVRKRLISCDELTAVQKFAGNARTSHYAMTLPWSDSGLRMLTTSRYFDYHASITALQGEFFNLVEKFLSRYEWQITEVQLKLGDLFDSAEYPSLDKVRNKFDFRLNYIPLPSAGDFRVDIGNEAELAMREHYEKFYAEQLGRAMGDIWKRAHVILSRMSDRLDYKGKEDKKLFHDTLVSNVVDLIGVMENMNVTGDPNMQLQQRRLKMAMQGVDPNDLRHDPILRENTKRTVDEVLATLPSLDF